MPIRADLRAKSIRQRLSIVVGRSSPDANGAIGHDKQTAVDLELEKGREMTPDEGRDGTAARCGRAKDDNAVVAAHGSPRQISGFRTRCSRQSIMGPSSAADASRIHTGTHRMLSSGLFDPATIICGSHANRHIHRPVGNPTHSHRMSSSKITQ